ncbi:8-amino-7-oxononanoate synthase [Effusibacillus pohliae]|uniref:8-amino-7-oxononanoate synthase n=1 Tax=Effusibacillus pohliae TaxID=232270 RepID=UPI000364E3C9|nr:8-amino-7-oxononanoate synthase [Effusibacillus pohliae]
MENQLKQKFLSELEQLRQIAQNRGLAVIEEAEQPWLQIGGKRLLNLASNNYLGLAGHERLKKAACAAIETHGCGATASRLIVGNHLVYRRAEESLVKWKGSEAGLIFNSGYTANIGIISSLAGRDAIIFSDRLNHASIIDGIRLSRSECQRYRHNDLDHLESLLKKTTPSKPKLIVSDTVFSMDGDVADLAGLVTLKERYGALLIVDEAHASGVFGPYGEGYVHHLGLQDRVDVQMGTFSKALGCFGAYVAGDRWLIDYLINKARSFIFTTGLPPAVLASAAEAIELVQEDWQRRQALQENSRFFREELARLGFDLCNSSTQIVPIVIGPNEKTLLFSQKLQQLGVAAIAVRPPTVPDNQARIRFTLMATHRRQDLAEAVEKIALVGRELGVIR